MKDADQMTSEELRILADEKERYSDKPIKSAELKHDLIYFNHDDICRKCRDYDWWVTEEELNNFIQSIKAGYLNVDKGTMFSCFLDDNIESWYDDADIGLEALSSWWAEKHLINIVKL